MYLGKFLNIEQAMNMIAMLPYDALSEQRRWVNQILYTLCIGIRSNNVVYIRIITQATQAVFACKSLRKFLQLKGFLLLEERILFAKFLLSLVNTAQEDFDLACYFATCAEKIIRKEERIKSDAIIIKWKPLYTIIHSAIFPRKRDLIPQKIKFVILNVVSSYQQL
jgi:hypothetical protein